jgi:capsule polysaccharide export protein KpsC/LpsZ
MKTKKTLPQDADLTGADTALKRAAKKARALAKQTRTPFYVYEDGKVVDLSKRTKKTP